MAGARVSVLPAQVQSHLCVPLAVCLSRSGPHRRLLRLLVLWLCTCDRAPPTPSEPCHNSSYCQDDCGGACTLPLLMDPVWEMNPGGVPSSPTGPIAPVSVGQQICVRAHHTGHHAAAEVQGSHSCCGRQGLAHHPGYRFVSRRQLLPIKAIPRAVVHA